MPHLNQKKPNRTGASMKPSTAATCLILCLTTALFAQTLPSTRGGAAGRAGGGRGQRGPNYDAFYQLGPDSLPQPGVPHGTLVGPTTLPTQVYVGPVPTSTRQNGASSLTALSAAAATPMHYVHGYWVYVPAQYDPSKPAALIVFNDGQPMMAPRGDIRAINVIDNLTWRREIPVAITVFLDPGRPAGTPEPDLSRDWGDNTTLRPWEYQWLDDNYPRVVCDELLPVITSQYNISPDPEMHAIMGASSGAIAAFTVAWQRPNTFRKVISIVGSFTHIRGGAGDSYPELVAAADKKPIRVFFQDGVNDNRTANLTGDWHYQNVRLINALTQKGYDVNYSFGIGVHGQKQGGAILPDMMRWLWRDYPRDFDVKNVVERSFNGPASRP
jgi:enterochelin esterase family protein